MKIDPLKRPCSCGYYWYFNKWDYIFMILFGKKTKRCPKCGRKHEYKLVYHCIEKFDNTRLQNKDLAEGKQQIWRQS